MIRQENALNFCIGEVHEHQAVESPAAAQAAVRHVGDRRGHHSVGWPDGDRRRQPGHQPPRDELAAVLRSVGTVGFCRGCQPLVQPHVPRASYSMPGQRLKFIRRIRYTRE